MVPEPSVSRHPPPHVTVFKHCGSMAHGINTHLIPNTEMKSIWLARRGTYKNPLAAGSPLYQQSQAISTQGPVDHRLELEKTGELRNRSLRKVTWCHGWGRLNYSSSTILVGQSDTYEPACCLHSRSSSSIRVLLHTALPGACFYLL